MTKAPRDSTTKRRPRAPSKRVRSELSGPLREVVYIFEREGERGGGFWWLVLACGHAVARKRVMPSVGCPRIRRGPTLVGRDAVTSGSARSWPGREASAASSKRPCCSEE